MPTSLVVKNGSKIFPSLTRSMPHPLSLTVRQTNTPSRASGLRSTYSLPTFTGLVVTMSEPPSAMASRALSERFMITCSIIVESASIAGRRGGEIAAQRDVFAQAAPQHLRHALDDLVQVEQLDLHELLAAEREQLPGEVRGALRGDRHLVERFLGRVGQAFGSPDDQLRVALDDGEDVVEIMRDAGGELADGLHFLRLAQLRLQVEPLGDFRGVAMDALERRDREKRP